MKKYTKLVLAVVAVISSLCFVIYKYRYDRLYHVMQVLEVFGSPEEDASSSCHAAAARTVPSWQQLPGHPQQLQTQPPPGTLLVPADDWRRPLIAAESSASSGSIRLTLDQVFPVVYSERQTSRERSGTSYSSGSKRGTGHKPLPAHQASASSSSASSHSGSGQRQFKKEVVTQLSPVKKRIKENKDHYIGKNFTERQRPTGVNISIFQLRTTTRVAARDPSAGTNPLDQAPQLSRDLLRSSPSATVMTSSLRSTVSL